MKWQVIASVDETKRSRDAVSGGRESTPSARPVVYISREQSIQHKLRNSVVALSLAGASSEDVQLYASVKVYSQQSALFRKDNYFPEKLNWRQPDSGSSKHYDVVVSNLLWWQLHQLQKQSGALREFREDSAMPIGTPPILIHAKLISDIGNATHLTVVPATLNNYSQPHPKGAAIAQSLSGSVVSLNGWLSYRSPNGAQTFKVINISTTSIDLPNVGIMSEATSIHIQSSVISLPNSLSSGALVSKDKWIDGIKGDVGGYDDLLSEIVGHLYGYVEDAALSNHQTDAPSCFQAPMKGVMISGRPGTGKSVLASSLAEHSGLPYTVINCPDVFQTNAGASENYLRSAFTSLLSQNRVSIVILDEVDMIASSRSSRKGVEAKLFSTLLHIVDSVNMQPTGNKVFIIALTNRLHAVDSSLTRSGRLDKVYDLHLKGVEQRLGALRILSKDLPMNPSKREDILRNVAKVTHGFVPTDLQALCIECALALISQMAAGQSTRVVDMSYFDRALKMIRPSGMGEFLSKIPTVTFNDLYGMHDAIADLKVSVIDPFYNPGKYLDLGISPPRGVIVHGPPGVGKTMLCCALAEELGINFMLVESSQIRSKVVGESEQNIARMFAQAKANAPCILFIDQIDVLAPSRGSTNTSENSGDRIVTGLLTEMDGFFTAGAGKSAQVDVLVLAATNRPEVIDSAILRPGRLDQIIHIPVPDQKVRQAVLEGYMSKMPMRITSEEIHSLSRATEGYSGADLENLCREAALICLRQDITNTEIALSHLESAKLVSKPSLLGYEDHHLFSR
ncbi:hypothetical protein EC991_011002 [Linnemannia zychae]|nr:hypothetical protein EC991_011002 [Linnemannia zychae]